MVRSGISAFLLSLLAASSLAQLPLPQGLEFEVYPFGEPGIGVTSRIVAEDRSEFLLLGQELGDDGRTLTATGRFYGGDGFPVAEPVVFEGFTGCAPFGVSGLLTEERVLFVWTPLPPFVPGGGTGPPCSQETPRAVRAQWFSRQGAPEGEAFQVSTTEEGERYYPSAAMLSDGSLLISWAQVGPERSGDEFDFYILSRQLGRRFSAAGESLGPELNFRVNQDFESEGGRSVVVPDAGDSFLLIWEYDGGEGTFGEVAYQSFSFSGTPLSDKRLLGTDDERGGPQSLQDHVRLPGGAVAVAWASYLKAEGNFAPGFAIQRISPSGTPIGERFIWRNSFDFGRETDVRLGRSGEDRLLLAWDLPQDRSFFRQRVGGRWLDTELRPLSETFEVSANLADFNFADDVLFDEEGGATVLFSSFPSPGGVLGRRLAVGCTSGPNTLCLGEGDRFRAEVAWLDFAGRDGQAGASELSSESGSFWFFRPDNVELVAKVVDGRRNNGHFWTFYGALSNVAYQLTVTDTLQSLQKVYSNPARTFASVGDTRAFPGGGGGAAFHAPTAQAPVPLEARDLLDSLRQASALKGDALPGTTSGDSLEFEGGRFRATITWRDFAGRTGVGHPAMLTEDTGTFWFFNPDRTEVVVKLLDGRPRNGNFWVFYGALTNVEYTLTVEDTLRGTNRTYVNPLRNFGSVGDTRAFPE